MYSKTPLFSPKIYRETCLLEILSIRFAISDVMQEQWQSCKKWLHLPVRYGSLIDKILVFHLSEGCKTADWYLDIP